MDLSPTLIAIDLARSANHQSVIHQNSPQRYQATTKTYGHSQERGHHLCTEAGPNPGGRRSNKARSRISALDVARECRTNYQTTHKYRNQYQAPGEVVEHHVQFSLSKERPLDCKISSISARDIANEARSNTRIAKANRGLHRFLMRHKTASKIIDLMEQIKLCGQRKGNRGSVKVLGENNVDETRHSRPYTTVSGEDGITSIDIDSKHQIKRARQEYYSQQQGAKVLRENNLNTHMAQILGAAGDK